MPRNGRGVRLTVVYDTRLSTAVARANAEADKIEEVDGYVLDIDYERVGDRHYCLVKHTWGGGDDDPLVVQDP